MPSDFLIIGQGLAGSLLAWELIRRKQTVLVVDNGIQNASQVAAGLVNPITGKRFVKTTNVDELLPTAKNYFAELEQFFQKSFYIEKPMLRLLRNTNEKDAANKRLNQTEYQAYLSGISDNHQNIYSQFGLLHQSKTGYLKTRDLLGNLKEFLISNGQFRHATINYSDIQLYPELKWKNLGFRNVIFCEGFQSIHNPWFNWLPMKPVKGEIITASTEQLTNSHILNYGNWLIPLEGNQFKTGATFDRENMDTKVTENARQTLLESLHLNVPDLQQIKIINQHAGIRPTTLDRQPFIGKHPSHSNLAIFNGFGTKGSLQIPFYCQLFTDALLDNKTLPVDIDIKRHYESHFSI